MTFNDIFKKSFLEGYALADLSPQTITLCLLIACGIGVYIFVAHRLICRKSFYNKSFGIALIALPMITTAIILAVQSSVVISLGMVGALSIVRFRTAIKDPMDLVFLFWAISVGIICGAGFAMIAIIVSLWFTVLIIVFNMLPAAKENLVLVVNADSYLHEAEIMGVVKETCSYAKVRARNASKNSLNIAVEVRVTNQGELIQKLLEIDSVSYASLVEHDGEVTA